MTGIKAIADKYDLNKSYVCYVDAGGQLTKFVLFTRGIWIDDKANKLEFSVNTPDFFECSDIISVGKHFGFTDGRLISSSFGDDNQKNSVFTLTGECKEMNSMLLYLALEYERTEILGIYNETSPNNTYQY